MDAAAEEKTDVETTITHKESVQSKQSKDSASIQTNDTTNSSETTTTSATSPTPDVCTSPPEIRRIKTTPLSSIASGAPISLKRYHSNNATLSPDSALMMAKSATFPDSDYSDNEMEFSENETIKKKKKKRRKSSFRKLTKRISTDNLMNVSRSISSYKSKAMIKLKNKKNDEIFTDSKETKSYKRRLDTFESMDKTLQIAKKLYNAQIAHSKAMNAFCHCIHSNIDLGKKRGQNNANYFGQYLKMMASTLQSIEGLYVEHNTNLNNWLIEPFEEFVDGNDDVQNCVNLKYEYNQIRNNFNNKPSSKHRIELEDIEQTFQRKTKELLQKREDNVIWKLVQFESNLVDYGQKYVNFIKTKRVINGYDEMKAKEIEKKNKIKEQIQNELVHIETDKEFEECLLRMEDVSYSIVMFHRDKFPPSMKFLTECFAPLSSKFGSYNFVIVHYKCYAVMEKYEVSIFPTCLIFEKNKICSKYQAIVGNSEMSRDELQSIVNAMDSK